MVLSGFNKSDKSYFQSVAQLLGAIVISARSTSSRPDVLVAKRNNTSNAIAAFNSGTPVVRSDWLMACWAQAARVPTAKFAWGVDNDDDDDDNDDATLLTQRQLPLRSHTTNIRATTSNLNAPTLKQHSTTNGVARSVNDSLFSLNRLKKTATSWWSRFVGDVEQEQPPITVEVVDDDEEPPVSHHFNHINEDNERPSSTTSTDDDVDVVEIDDPAPPSPAHPAVELSFQFVDIESSQSVSQAVGAATQQAMALSQRFLPCMPVQFDDFALAATQRIVEPRRTFNDDDDGEAKTQRRTDIHYGLPRSHKRLRADLLGEEFHEPVNAAEPVTPKEVVVVEPIEVIVVEDESPTKRARKKDSSKKPADDVPPVASAEVADSDSPWASDVYDGASQLDIRCQLVTRELEKLKAIEKNQKAIENEKKAGKQRRALKKLSVIALSPINAKTAGHRRRTRRRKTSHTKHQ